MLVGHKLRTEGTPKEALTRFMGLMIALVTVPSLFTYPAHKQTKNRGQEYQSQPERGAVNLQEPCWEYGKFN